MIVVIEIILALMGFSATKNDCIKSRALKIEKGFF
tara:strand:- start:1032 stop:1136 length:105 start_codon:yes stop_codon:yes gene_type:complete